jgi:ABC-type molybdate transport system permease subunit
VVPEHTGVLPLTLPPAVAGFTVTVVVDELASGHVPL